MAISRKIVSAALAVTLIAATAIYWTAIRPEQRITTILKRWANDPESLRLEEMQQSKRDPEVWCGRLNARNRMGGMAGFKKFVISAPGVYELRADAELVVIFSNITFEDQPGFAARRSLYCE